MAILIYDIHRVYTWYMYTGAVKECILYYIWELSLLHSIHNPGKKAHFAHRSLMQDQFVYSHTLFNYNLCLPKITRNTAISDNSKSLKSQFQHYTIFSKDTI